MSRPFLQVLQLYETTIVRHGLMLVGPTMGGKTACYRSLQKAMTRLAMANNEHYERVRGWEGEHAVVNAASFFCAHICVYPYIPVHTCAYLTTPVLTCKDLAYVYTALSMFPACHYVSFGDLSCMF